MINEQLPYMISSLPENIKTALGILALFRQWVNIRLLHENQLLGPLNKQQAKETIQIITACGWGETNKLAYLT